MEATGSVSEVLSGVFPYVHIHAFSKSILEYKGNVYLRQLKTYVPTDQTRGCVKKYIGCPYESLNTLTELFYAVNQANKEEKVKNVFCSELATLFYKEIEVIEHDAILSNNVIPEMLSSGAGENDLLKDKALSDIPLKMSFSVDENDNKIDTCWKWFMKKVFKCCFK